MDKTGLWGLVLAVVSSPGIAQQTGTAAPDAAANRRADSHFHLLDFLQNGEFLNTDGMFPGTEWGVTESGRYSTLPYGERGRRIEALLRGMEEAQVDHVMVSGMPFIKKWSENEPFLRPRYYLDSSSRVKRARDTDITVASAIVDYRAKYADDPARLAELRRIHPFITGFDGTDLGAVDLIVKRIKEFPGVWEGIGEVMSRHDDLNQPHLWGAPTGRSPGAGACLPVRGRALSPGQYPPQYRPHFPQSERNKATALPGRIRPVAAAVPMGRGRGRLHDAVHLVSRGNQPAGHDCGLAILD